MKKVSGTFNGTGAALRVCIGFIPDYVMVQNIEDAGTLWGELRWSVNDRSAECAEGLFLDKTTGITPLTYGTGVAIYRGGDVFTAAQTAYIVRDPSPDKRAAGTGGTISLWTLDTSGNRTGHWDYECSTTYVGEGSRMTVKERLSQKVKTSFIAALSNNGAAANEVTLQEALKTGDIISLTGMYDYLGLAANTVSPAGFVINETANVNVSGELCFFEAGTYQ